MRAGLDAVVEAAREPGLPPPRSLHGHVLPGPRGDPQPQDHRPGPRGRGRLPTGPWVSPGPDEAAPPGPGGGPGAGLLPAPPPPPPGSAAGRAPPRPPRWRSRWPPGPWSVGTVLILAVAAVLALLLPAEPAAPPPARRGGGCWPARRPSGRRPWPPWPSSSGSGVSLLLFHGLPHRSRTPWRSSCTPGSWPRGASPRPLPHPEAARVMQNAIPRRPGDGRPSTRRDTRPSWPWEGAGRRLAGGSRPCWRVTAGLPVGVRAPPPRPPRHRTAGRASLVAISPFLVLLGSAVPEPRRAPPRAPPCASTWPFEAGRGARGGAWGPGRPRGPWSPPAPGGAGPRAPPSPLGLWVAAWGGKDATERWLGRRLGGAAVGGAPFALALAAYNRALFGAPSRFGYEAAFGPAHGLGFHRDPWGNLYGLREAVAYTGCGPLHAGAPPPGDAGDPGGGGGGVPPGGAPPVGGHPGAVRVGAASPWPRTSCTGTTATTWAPACSSRRPRRGWPWPSSAGSASWRAGGTRASPAPGSGRGAPAFPGPCPSGSSLLASPPRGCSSSSRPGRRATAGAPGTWPASHPPEIDPGTAPALSSCTGPGRGGWRPGWWPWGCAGTRWRRRCAATASAEVELYARARARRPGPAASLPAWTWSPAPARRRSCAR